MVTKRLNVGKIEENREKGRLKRKFLVTITNLLSMREHIPVSKDILNDLFEMERKTLIILVLLETIILYILLPKIGNMVSIWYAINYGSNYMEILQCL